MSSLAQQMVALGGDRLVDVDAFYGASGAHAWEPLAVRNKDGGTLVSPRQLARHQSQDARLPVLTIKDDGWLTQEARDTSKALLDLSCQSFGMSLAIAVQGFQVLGEVLSFVLVAG